MDESMNGFSERQKAFEAKYHHDEDLNFKINIKRIHLFAIWAADLLGYKDEKATLYIDEVIVIEVQKTHQDDVLHKILRDLEKANLSLSEHQVRKEFERCWEEAHILIMKKEDIQS